MIKIYYDENRRVTLDIVKDELTFTDIRQLIRQSREYTGQLPIYMKTSNRQIERLARICKFKYIGTEAGESCWMRDRYV